MNGWIKIHRKILDWGWYDDTNTTRLFLHLLLIANHKPHTWHGVEIGIGQAVVGRKELSKRLGISEQSIRTSLAKLKSTNEITIRPTNRFSVITVLKYSDYQIDEKNQPTPQPTSQPTTNQQLTTPKEYKKVRTIMQPSVARAIPTNAEVMADKRRHVQIIGLYWNYLDMRFENRKQFDEQLKRHARVASSLTGYSDKQILGAMKWYDKQSKNGTIFSWKLETILGKIQELISNNQI